MVNLPARWNGGVRKLPPHPDTQCEPHVTRLRRQPMSRPALIESHRGAPPQQFTAPAQLPPSPIGNFPFGQHDRRNGQVSDWMGSQIIQDRQPVYQTFGRSDALEDGWHRNYATEGVCPRITDLPVADQTVFKPLIDKAMQHRSECELAVRAEDGRVFQVTFVGISEFSDHCLCRIFDNGARSPYFDCRLYRNGDNEQDHWRAEAARERQSEEDTTEERSFLSLFGFGR